MRYLTIGHICQDIVPNGWMFGGAATYSARTAHALGCEVQVITSLRADVDVRPALADIEVVRFPAEHTTTFENVYIDHVRHQTLHAVAERLTPDRFPTTRTADIVHLAPIAQEVDLGWLDCFPGALIGVTPQGWLRQWDAQGRVSPIGWAEAARVLPRADVVIISIEDVAHDEALVQQWAAQAKLLMVTRGAHGCTVHQNNSATAVPAHAVEIVDATGAGDIFAASFLVRLRQTGDPIAAARFANCLASQSITRRGLDSIPTPAEIDQCRRV
ncbi:MAG TPA: PfkB family carbohydrate kinase [Anaerolineae bacterium]|nr:PfkB family carbohydrate kinase [Anaerolineae bacterium]